MRRTASVESFLAPQSLASGSVRLSNICRRESVAVLPAIPAGRYALLVVLVPGRKSSQHSVNSMLLGWPKPFPVFVRVDTGTAYVRIAGHSNMAELEMVSVAVIVGT